MFQYLRRRSYTEELRGICLQYSYEQIQQYTNDFSEKNTLGQGAFGAVYKGRMPDGSTAAVKEIKLANLDSGEDGGFEAEIRIMSQFRHPNLVTLLGWGKHEQRRFLLYECLSGGNLEERLEKSKSDAGKPFLWQQRLSVVLDAATGLAHMHSFRPPAFHRDIKSANILIDGRTGVAKMADFGLSCMTPDDDVNGTPGYICPTYERTGNITEGSEVYSFGVVLFEIIWCTSLGMAPVDEQVFAHAAGAVERCIQHSDPTARWPGPVLIELARLAISAVREDDEQRPKFHQVCQTLRRLSPGRTTSDPAPIIVKQGADQNEYLQFMPQFSDLSSMLSFQIGSSSTNCQQYPYEEIQRYTNYFSEVNKLGQGGFGSVYKASLPDGSAVAIKEINLAALEGTNGGFEAEISTLSKFRHPNLVTLLGWAKHEQLRFLIYEYLTGGDLEGMLHKSRGGGEPFLWNRRLRVALDAATGLAHMHNATPPAFHRDIKSANILIDGRSGVAKMADFGLSCVAAQKKRAISDEFIFGTPGYICPTYESTGRITEGSEVYSYGMVVLEMICNISAAAPVSHSISGSSISSSSIQWGSPVKAFVIPHAAGALDRCMQQSDPHANWPRPVLTELVKLALGAVDEDEQRRPSFNTVCQALRTFSNLYKTAPAAVQQAAVQHQSLQHGQPAPRSRPLASTAQPLATPLPGQRSLQPRYSVIARAPCYSANAYPQ